MPRPRKRRMVSCRPEVAFYKPQGTPLAGLEEMVLPVEGLEALRLADAEGLDQASAAEIMGVSRPTFSRVLAQARRAVATALTRGMAIRIQGGDYHIAAEPPERRPGRGCGKGRGGRGGGGRGGRRG